MAVLSAIIAIGAMAATRNLGVELRDLYCQVYGGVRYASEPGGEFDRTKWYWSTGKPPGCKFDDGWG